MDTAAEFSGAACSRIDRLVQIEGTVQGVGFRPFVARLAARHELRGWIRNDARGVTLRLEGAPASLDRFAAALAAEAPPAARITSLRPQPVNGQLGLPPLPSRGFIILESERAAAPAAAVTPDLALCADCARELTISTDRRHLYPFINCTHCGPRYSIIDEIPYDRARTTMAAFTMCPECQREYTNPADRRYHAQPNACPRCGPHAELWDRRGRRLATHDHAIRRAARLLRTGRIVAVKGLGGFHLLADATDETAVSELRRRKHREEKPFAVMFPSLALLRATVEASDDDVRVLTSPAAPIVLLPRRSAGSVCRAVAPGNPLLGALLPYTPLHVLLLRAVDRPVVATSGNFSEEPLAIDNEEALERLGGIADFFLVHDRRIARPIDDSVVRTSPRGPIRLRRARGFAPNPLALPAGTSLPQPLLCVGGHMKNTIALAAGRQVIASPHLGDLDHPLALQAFRRAIELLRSLYETEFAGVVCDAHPDYASTHFAESLGLPLTRVQHHLAHILACLLEYDGGPDLVLGVAWDGTGYGSDSTIWGGEFIVVDRRARTAERVGRLRPFRLPGGDAAIREPRRSAIAVLHEVVHGDRDTADPLALRVDFRSHEIDTLWTMLDRGVCAPVTSSAGRLFDAAAALLGLRQHCSFEGQAAMELEFAAQRWTDAAEPWPMPISPVNDSAVLELDWRPALAELAHAQSRVPAAELAARFHATLVRGIAEVATRLAIPSVVLTGGCFQNALLLESTSAALDAGGLAVLRHRELPPNDGALSAGQALAAAWGMAGVADAARRDR